MRLRRFWRGVERRVLLPIARSRLAGWLVSTFTSETPVEEEGDG